MILLTYLLMEGCVIGFSLSYRNWVQHTDVITKTGLCTGIVWYESRFSFKTSSLPFAMLHFDDGSEYLGGECMEGKLPRELTIGYVRGWRNFQYLPVVSITDGETVYLTLKSGRRIRLRIAAQISYFCPPARHCWLCWSQRGPRGR